MKAGSLRRVSVVYTTIVTGYLSELAVLQALEGNADNNLPSYLIHCGIVVIAEKVFEILGITDFKPWVETGEIKCFASPNRPARYKRVRCASGSGGKFVNEIVLWGL